MHSLADLVFLDYAIVGVAALFSYIANVRRTSYKTPIESHWETIDSEAVPAVGIEAVLDAIDHSTFDGCGDDEDRTTLDGEAEDEAGSRVDGEDGQDDDWTIV